MHMHMILVDPNLHEMPIGIVSLYFPQLDAQIISHALDKELAAESGHPHTMVLRLVDVWAALCSFTPRSLPEAAGLCSHPRLYRRGPPLRRCLFEFLINRTGNECRPARVPNPSWPPHGCDPVSGMGIRANRDLINRVQTAVTGVTGPLFHADVFFDLTGVVPALATSIITEEVV